MIERYRPAIAEPMFLVFSREQVEKGGVEEALRLLHNLTSSPDYAVTYCGRASLIIDGYNADPRELFEVPEVRAFIQAIDNQWPYWFFFLSQADDSIKIIESCLCDSIEVIPGVTSLDLAQMERSLARHFGALNRLCEALNLPESKNQEISEGIISLIHNASVERIDGDNYQ